jgi:hypothetical protein
MQRSSYYLAKSNGAFNKGKQVHRNNFLTESLHLFLLQDQGQLIQLPSTTLMLAVGGSFGGQDS